MKFLHYKKACRSCMTGDEQKFMIVIKNSDSDPEIYHNGKLKSEFEISSFIERFLRNTKQPCEYCDSDNLQIFDVSFDGKVAFDQNDNGLFEIFLTKENNEIELRTGGGQYLPKGFLPDAFHLIAKTIDQIPEEKFEEFDNGHAHIVVSTESLIFRDPVTNRIEKFNFAGFGKLHLIAVIRQVQDHMIKANSRNE